MREAISPPVGGSFELVDHHGNAVQSASLVGRYLLIFFGFTHCRAVCPENLAKLSRVLERLGPLSALVQPLYISVDPERDSPEVMNRFLGARYPRFLGLTGPREAIDRVRAQFRVFAQRAADDIEPNGYAVPHTAITYIMDETGAYCAHFLDGTPEEEIEARLRALLCDHPEVAKEKFLDTSSPILASG